MRRFLTAAFLALWSISAAAQTSPGFVQGQIPSAPQWNGYFIGKLDTTNGIANGLTLNGAAFSGSLSGTPTITGSWLFNAAPNLAAGATLGGTLGGSPTASGPWIFASPVTFGATGNVLTITPATLAGQPINLTQSGTGGIATPAELFLTGAGTGLSVSHNALVGGTLGVTGVATFSATGSGGSILGGSGQALIISPGSTNQNIQFGAGTFGVGSVATMTLSSAGLPGNGTTGHVLTVNNLLVAPFYRTPGNTYTLSGTTIPYTALVSASFAGTYSGGQDAFMKFTVPTDNVNSTVQAIADTAVYANYGGSAFAGARIGNLSQMNQNGNMASGASINAQASWLFAGCNGCTNPLAKYYAGGVQTVVAINTTAYGAFGAEDNIKTQSGDVLNYKAIRTFINETGDTIQGALYDTIVGISSQNNVTGSSTIGGLNLVAFGRPDGQYPGDPAGTQIGEYRQTGNASDNTVAFKRMVSGCGYCQPDVQFASFSLQLPAFSVSGVGLLSDGALTITPSSTGATIDVTLKQLTASSVVAGGTNYIQGEDVYDANGDSWTLTNVSGGVVQAGGITLRNTGYGSASSGTFSTTNGHGTGLTISETWTAPTALNFGTGTATAIGIGNSGSTLTLAGTVTMPTSTTGAGTQTFVNSPCSGLTTEKWIPVHITGQTGTWNIPACQ